MGYNSILDEDVKKCLEVLKSGGIILYPTDTVWGLGCDPTNVEAVKKIYEIKKREDSKSLILLASNVAMIERYVEEVPDIAEQIVEMATTPTTIIYSDAKNLSENVIAEDGSVGFRVTNEAFTAALLERFKRPIVSTSANISGEPTPAIFSEISEEIISAADYVVNYRRDDVNKAQPSKIIKIENNGVFKIIRG